MSISSATLLSVAVFLSSIASAGAQPSGWTSPGVGKELGFLATQCDKREFCFAVACPAGRIELVNISPGGGPYGISAPDGRGGASLQVGTRTFRLSFAVDDRILESLNVAGSRAELPIDALVALATTDGVMKGMTTAAVTATIRKTGLRAAWPLLARSCGLPGLPQ